MIRHATQQSGTKCLIKCKQSNQLQLRVVLSATGAFRLLHHAHSLFHCYVSCQNHTTIRMARQVTASRSNTAHKKEKKSVKTSSRQQAVILHTRKSKVLCNFKLRPIGTATYSYRQSLGGKTQTVVSSALSSKATSPSSRGRYYGPVSVDFTTRRK